MPSNGLPEIILRKEAKARGLKRYFTGRPCKRKHISERNTSNLTCLACMRDVPPICEKPAFIPSQHKVAEPGLSRKEYDQRPERKAAKAEDERRYRNSAKGKEAQKRRAAKGPTEASRRAGLKYSKTLKGKLSALRAARSPKGRASQKRYASSDKGRLNATLGMQRRRARIRMQLGSFTATDYNLLRQNQKRCHLCGKPFTKTNPATLDHLVPLARGGLHDKTNILLAHLTCNLSKNATRTHLI